MPSLHTSQHQNLAQLTSISWSSQPPSLPGHARFVSAHEYNSVYKQNNTKHIVIKLNVSYNCTQSHHTRCPARNNYAIKYMAYFCWSKKFPFSWTTFYSAESQQWSSSAGRAAERAPAVLVRAWGRGVSTMQDAMQWAADRADLNCGCWWMENL